ncbi:uncharacterized protein LOC100175241 [Ciona intestinalis]
MKVYQFVSVLLVASTLTFQETSSNPVPTTSTLASNNVTEDANQAGNQIPEADGDSLNCIMEAISVMVSGNEQSLSEACKEMIKAAQDDDDEPESVVNSEDENSDANDDVSEPPSQSPDLQAELQDLTSQLRGIDADYDVSNEDHGLGMKRSDGDADDVKRSGGGDAETSDDIENSEIEVEEPAAPFVTSLNDINDEFLVIPLKYLRKQMMNEEMINDDVADVVNKKQNEDDKNAKLEDTETDLDENGTDDVTKGAEWDGDATSEMDMEQLNALYQVQMDLKKLGQDMKYLKQQQQTETPAQSK